MEIKSECRCFLLYYSAVVTKTIHVGALSFAWLDFKILVKDSTIFQR